MSGNKSEDRELWLRNELKRLKMAAPKLVKPAVDSNIGPAGKKNGPLVVKDYLSPAGSILIVPNNEPEIRPAVISETPAASLPPERPNNKPLFQLVSQRNEGITSNCPLRILSFLTTIHPQNSLLYLQTSSSPEQKSAIRVLQVRQ